MKADKELQLHQAVYDELEELEKLVGPLKLAPLRRVMQRAVQHAYHTGMLDLLDCRTVADNDIRADLVGKVRTLNDATLRAGARLTEDDKQRDELRREDSAATN